MFACSQESGYFYTASVNTVLFIMNVNQYICTYIHKYIYILYIYHKSPESNRLRKSILDNFFP